MELQSPVNSESSVVSASNAPTGRDTPRPCRISGSRGLMRISAPLAALANSACLRTVGTAQPGPDLHDDQRRIGPPPLGERVELGLRTVAEPVPITEHEDVGAGETSAVRTRRQRRPGPHGLVVHLHRDVVGGPDPHATVGQALEVVDGAVHLRHVLEPGALELAVDIGGEHVDPPGLAAPHCRRIAKPLCGSVSR